ncbi:polymorphic toxin-type HINT domain-containing protein [Kitasatospora sp. NPDC096128]|uniref:polymorphic toxin-type HINT domain-containing protein n=1 Tax=Kitasatospora sp. NPDC096128 TaxID=3155547 RepID=UPI003316A445
MSSASTGLAHRGRRAGLRLLCRTVLPVALLASALSVAPATADGTTPTPPLTDRGRVLQAWKVGGPSVKAAAEIALAGTSDQVRLFLGTPQNPQDGELAKAETKDTRAALLQMVTAGGPRLRAAAETALAGTDQGVAAFAKDGWKAPLEQDQRVLVSQIAEAAGPRTKAAALAVLDKPTADIQAFLEQGRFSLQETDNRVRVSQLLETGGPATQQAAQIALDGSAEEIRTFLETGQQIAAARDQEHATIDQLVQQAQQAGAEASRKKDAAKEASDRAVEAAALAKKATDEAVAETLAAKDDAQRATAAARRAAEATQRAADAARASIAAARAAVQAANRASVAAGRAAAAAAGAAQATTRALASAAAGKVDEDAAAAATQAATQARAAGATADNASKAAIEAQYAAEKAASAVADVNATADAADQAGTYADRAGASSAEARQAAAKARRNAGEATRSANAAAKFAKEAGQAAAEARDAANSAADRATRAAESARNAAANAGNATNAAQQSAAHADSSRQAAAAADTAVTKARQVHAQALASEAEEQNSRTADGIVQAQDLKADYDAGRHAADDATAAALRLDQDAVQLAARASQPGADPATVVADGRRMALAALKVRGPWAKSAAEYALSGSDEAVVDYVRTAWQTSSEQDERAEARRLAENSEYDTVRTAARTALAGDGAAVHAFLRTGRHTAALSQYRVKVSQLIETGGPHLQQAAKAALETNTPDALVTFLARGRYEAKAVDDRLTASRLIETGGAEVKSAAQIAMEGPYPVLTDFLLIGQYQAQQQDSLTATHVASIDNAVNGASQVAALAKQNAAQAAQYAAVAAGAADAANTAAAQANAAANAAAGFAQQAKTAADQADASATKAAGYAASARTAQATANRAAESAQNSATYAAASAAAARGSADLAYAAVASARQSAENAGKSRDEARSIAENAQLDAVRQAQREDAIRRLSEQVALSVLHDYNAPSEFFRTWYDWFSGTGHTVLGLASYVPEIGPAAGAVNCAWYVGEGFAGYADTSDIVTGCAGALLGLKSVNAIAKDALKWGPKLADAGVAVGKWAANQGRKAATQVRKFLDRIPGFNSFPAGTLVLMADGTTRPIEQVHVGDAVTAADPQTGVSGPRTVRATISNPNDTEFTDLTVAGPDGGTSTLTATDNHPFWAQNSARWTDAADLRPGDTLRTDTGAAVRVVSVRHRSASAPAYNLTVDELHTYYVLAGDTPVLVHNDGREKFAEQILGRLPGWQKGDPAWGTVIVQGWEGDSYPLSGALPSGEGADAQEIAAFLHSSGPANGLVETKLAWQMVKNRMSLGEVVINDPQGPCDIDGDRTACLNAVRSILPKGYLLRVWWKDPAGAMKWQDLIGARDLTTV